MVWMTVGLIAAVLITGTMGYISSPVPQGAAAAYPSSPAGAAPAAPNPYSNYLAMVSSAQAMPTNASPRQGPQPNAQMSFGRAPMSAAQRRRSPMSAAQPRRQPPSMRLLNFIGKVKAARDMDCKTTPDHLGLELPRYLPMKCSGMCMFPTTCRTVGHLGFCCPFLVTDQLISVFGRIETFKLL